MATKPSSPIATRELKSSSESELTCSVCLEQFKDPKVLPCCHTFCKQCLLPLVKRRDIASSQPESTAGVEDEQQPYSEPDQSELAEVIVELSDEEEEVELSDEEEEVELSAEEEVELSDEEQEVVELSAEELSITGSLLDTPADSDILSCPQCRVEHVVPEEGVDGFLTNFLLVHDLEVAAVVKAKEKKPSCGQCESSDPSVAYCVECEAFLCEFCSSAHKRMKSYKEHNVLPFDKISSNVLKLSAKQTSCNNHPGEDIKLYCKTCQQLICRDCALVDHRSHNFHFASQERQGFEKTLEKVVSKSRAKLEVYQKELQKVNKIEKYLQNAPDDIKKQITATFDTYLSALQSRREALLAQVDGEYQADSKKVWAHKDFTETAIADITASLRFAEQARKCTSDSEMISLTKQAVQRLDYLNGKDHKLDDTYEVVYNTASYDSSGIEEQILTCDNVVRVKPKLNLSPVDYATVGQKVTITVSLANCSFQDDELTPTINITYGYFRKPFNEFTVAKTRKGSWTVTIECICGGNHTVSVSLLRFSADPITFTVSGEPHSGARVRNGPDGYIWVGGEGTVQSVLSVSTRQRQQQGLRRSYYQQQSTSWREVYVRWDNGSRGQYRWGTGSGDSNLQYAIELVPTKD